MERLLTIDELSKLLQVKKNGIDLFYVGGSWNFGIFQSIKSLTIVEKKPQRESSLRLFHFQYKQKLLVLTPEVAPEKP